MILYILIFSSIAFADINYISADDLSSCISDGPREFFTKPDLCEEKKGVRCLALDSDTDCKIVELIDNEVLDFIRKEQVDSCTSVIPEPAEGEEAATKSECQLKLEALVCEAGNPIMTETEVYCAVEIMKVDGKKLVESPVKKAAREAAMAIKAQQDAALASAMKAMDCGKSAQATMLVRNASKNLTTAQVKQIVATYAPIKGLLDTGSLQSAVEEIQAIQADGVLVTESDKEAIIAHINQCRQ